MIRNAPSPVALEQSALVFSDEIPTWLSSKTIRENIISTYESLDPKILQLKYGRELSAQKRRELIRKIINRNVTRLVFVESNPAPYCLIKLIFAEIPHINEYIFHIYGDFSKQTHFWLSLFDLLEGKKIRLLVGSNAQKRQLMTYLGKQNGRAISVVPFPLKKERNQSWALARRKSRRTLGFDRNDFVLTYAGRISEQKNVTLLLRFLEQFLKKHPNTGKRILVQLAGEFDDIGSLFANYAPNEGRYRKQWLEWFGKLPHFVRERVQIVGMLGPTKLRQLYLASDAYVSLSTVHDEDYGMAPLEALACGCPAILSAWGGYPDFATDKDRVKLVQVRITRRGIELDYLGFEKSLIKLLDQNESPTQRTRRILRYRNHYSIHTLSQELLKRIDGRAFSIQRTDQVLEQHVRRFVRRWKSGRPIFSSHSRKDALYYKIYKSYLHSKTRGS